MSNERHTFTMPTTIPANWERAELHICAEYGWMAGYAAYSDPGMGNEGIRRRAEAFIHGSHLLRGIRNAPALYGAAVSGFLHGWREREEEARRNTTGG